MFKLLVCLMVVCVSPLALAEDQPIEPQEPEISSQIQSEEAQESETSEVDEKIEILATEIQNLKSGFDLFAEVGTEGSYGLAPAASKIYRTKKGVSLGGYGEMVYENFARENQSGDPSNKTDQINFLRNILYVGYRFTDQLLFNSEIEFEHASTSGGVGEVSVEFAYIDYLATPLLNIRAGMVLIPMGFINEVHEPTTFFSTLRPLTERSVIPSTWRENGIGIFGSSDALDYRLYIINSLDATGSGASSASGFSSSGIRGGRQKGAKASAQDFALTGRLDFTKVEGLVVGTSFYLGQTAQDELNTSGDKIKGLLSLTDVHADYRYKGVHLRGLLAYSYLQDADDLSLINNDTIGEQMYGYYLEAGYDVLSKLRVKSQLKPFFRYERVNTQYKVPDGYAQNDAMNQELYTMGLMYLPHYLIVFKGDYQIQKNKLDTGVNQWNLSLGYVF